MLTLLQKWFQFWATVILSLGTLGSQSAAITQEVASFLGQDLKRFMLVNLLFHQSHACHLYADLVNHITWTWGHILYLTDPRC